LWQKSLEKIADEVAGVSQYSGASANTLVGCITLIEMQIISCLELAIAIDKGCQKSHKKIKNCQQKTGKQS
jgi:hypothetical protein